MSASNDGQQEFYQKFDSIVDYVKNIDAVKEFEAFVAEEKSKRAGTGNAEEEAEELDEQGYADVGRRYITKKFMFLFRELLVQMKDVFEDDEEENSKQEDRVTRVLEQFDLYFYNEKDSSEAQLEKHVRFIVGSYHHFMKSHYGLFCDDPMTNVPRFFDALHEKTTYTPKKIADYESGRLNMFDNTRFLLWYLGFNKKLRDDMLDVTSKKYFLSYLLFMNARAMIVALLDPAAYAELRETVMIVYDFFFVANKDYVDRVYEYYQTHGFSMEILGGLRENLWPLVQRDILQNETIIGATKKYGSYFHSIYLSFTGGGMEDCNYLHTLFKECPHVEENLSYFYDLFNIVQKNSGDVDQLISSVFDFGKKFMGGENEGGEGNKGGNLSSSMHDYIRMHYEQATTTTKTESSSTQAPQQQQRKKPRKQ